MGMGPGAGLAEDVASGLDINVASPKPKFKVAIGWVRLDVWVPVSSLGTGLIADRLALSDGGMFSRSMSSKFRGGTIILADLLAGIER